MPDHRIGFHTVGAPQRGQRQLHTDQHRLDALDTHHRLARDQHVAQRKARPAQRNPAPTRRPPRQTPARRPATAGPSPPTANPDPNTETPCPAHAAPHAGRPPPAPAARRPAPAAPPPPRPRSRADTVANLLCAAAVVVDGVSDIGQRHTGAVAVHPVGQRGRPWPPSAASVLPETANVVTGGAESGSRHRRRVRPLLEHHVRVRPAHAERRHRGAPRTLGSGPRASSVGTNSRVGDGSIAGFHCVKCRLGGICARCTASAALMKPAIPAAASRWPKLVFTAPSAQRAVAAPILIGQRFELDRVTQRGSGAVRLDVVHRSRGHVGAAQCAR